MTKRHESGDVHAPVEDTDVPFSLKVLVILMIAGLLGLAAILLLMANQMGLLFIPS